MTKNEKDATRYRGWTDVPRCEARSQEIRQASWILVGFGAYLLTWAIIVAGMNV